MHDKTYFGLVIKVRIVMHLLFHQLDILTEHIQFSHSFYNVVNKRQCNIYIYVYNVYIKQRTVRFSAKHLWSVYCCWISGCCKEPCRRTFGLSCLKVGGTIYLQHSIEIDCRFLNIISIHEYFPSLIGQVISSLVIPIAHP